MGITFIEQELVENPFLRRAKKLLCEKKEEEYHWLFHEDIALIAYAMMDGRNRTYRDLENSLEMRFQELSQHGGLAKGDYTPKEIPNRSFPITFILKGI